MTEDLVRKKSFDSAVEWADRARSTRFLLREQLRSQSTTLDEVLDRARVEDLIGRIKLLWVLESLPGAGKVATRRHLASLGLEESIPVGELSVEQRSVISAEFAVGSRNADTEPSGDSTAVESHHQSSGKAKDK